MSPPPTRDVAPPPSEPRFPPGIPFIVGNEAAERFSFYGMRAILWVYLAQTLLVRRMSATEADAQATEVTHLFMAGVYAFPLLGAILADRLLGKYRVIFWLSLVYVAGHAVLAVASETVGGMYLGLSLIAIGSGGIKPCVSANVGDQFTASNATLVSRVYQIFYFMINFGSFFSTLLIPVLYSAFGPEVAFGVPGVLMALAALVFWAGNRRFVKVPPKPGGVLGVLDFIAGAFFFAPLAILLFGAEFLPEDAGWVSWVAVAAITLVCLGVGTVVFVARQRREADNGFLAVMIHCLARWRTREPGAGFFDVARAKFGDEAAEGPAAVLKVAVVFSMVSVFWALFDQHASTWVKQADQMDLTLVVPYWISQWVLWGGIAASCFGLLWVMMYVSNLRLPLAALLGFAGIAFVGGLALLGVQLATSDELVYTLKSSQISAANPLLVMLIIPLLNLAVYAPLEKRGIVIRPLQRMTAGMFLAAMAFVVAALLQAEIDAGGVLGIAWQMPQYAVMTTAEVLVSTTGLEFAYTQAPRAMKSTIMGYWALCVAIGNRLVAALAFLQTESMTNFFWLFAGLMAIAATIFAVLAYFYKGKTYLQHE